jgi:hypothetical protein
MRSLPSSFIPCGMSSDHKVSQPAWSAEAAIMASQVEKVVAFGHRPSGLVRFDCQGMNCQQATEQGHESVDIPP